MREKTQIEIQIEKRVARIEKMRRLTGNFAVVFVCLFFFVTLTHRAALDTADDFVSRNTGVSDTEAELSMPFLAEKPPVGAGWLLKRAHLRWLCREEIRLNALRDGINFDNERAMKEYIAELRAFNAVAQNCFCEVADLKAAQADIEPFRPAIEDAAHKEALANGWGQWR